MTTEAKITVTCCDCPATASANQAKDGGPKTPLRWKRAEAGFRCPKCHAGQFMPRSIRLAILGPAEGEERDKTAMYEALYLASRDNGHFANYLLQRLLAADILLTEVIRGLPAFESGPHKGKLKLPPAPSLIRPAPGKPAPAGGYLDWYADATKLFPHVAPATLVQQAQMIGRYYAKERFAAAVAMTRNVRSYRWDGLPIVVPAQSWKLLEIENGAIVLRVQIGPGPGWLLRVFAEGKHLALMRQIAAGQVVPGTAMFVRRARAPRPGETKRVRVWYLRISASVPRPATRRGPGFREKTLTLGHDAESLLYGVDADGGDEVFEFPGLELRKSVVKFERLDRRRQIEADYRRAGWSRRKAQRWSADRTAACAKRVEKTKAEIALAAATLSRWCQANAYTAVDYDRTPRGFLDTFPYRALADRIKIALENAGVALHLLGEDPGDEPPGQETQVAFAGPGCETEVQG